MSKAITFVRPGIQPNGLIMETYFDTDGAVDSNWSNISGGAGVFNSGVFSGVGVAFAQRRTDITLGGTPGHPAVIGGTVAAGDTWGSLPSGSPEILYATTQLPLVNGANNDVAGLTGYNFATVIGATGAFNITGIAGGVDGQVLQLCDGVNQALTIVNNSGSSAVGNKILTNTGSNIVLALNGTVELTYSAARNAWLAKV